ncbi:MAG: hypothetical protein Q9219_004413 [cf. Caloplaca sp. 3 TL-2023]
MGAEDVMSAVDQPNIRPGPIVGHEGSIHCPWILPGEPCDFMVDTRNALGKHIYEKHIDPQLTLKCPLGSCAELVRKSNLPSHQAQQHQLDNYLCSWDDCLGTYPTSEDLSNHILNTHNSLDCRFGGCEVSLQDPMQLQNHVFEDHLEQNLCWSDDFLDQQYQSTCGFDFTDVSASEQQARNYQVYGDHQGQRQMPYYHATPHEPHYAKDILEQNTTAFPILNSCTAQAQSTGSDPSFLRHLRTNQGNDVSTMQITSPSCGTSTTAGSSEDQSVTDGHVCKWIVEVHTDSPCGLTFDTAAALQQHLRDDHCKPGKKSRREPRVPAICFWAGCARNREPLTDTHKLIRHALTHSDYREYKCKHCDKVFTTKGSQTTHERMVHTGEKPIKCEFCPKTTSNESQMAIHRRTHTGEKPFQCNICHFRCADSTNLNKHRKVHFPNEYRCEVCGHDFGTKYVLERHVRKKHRELLAAGAKEE